MRRLVLSVLCLAVLAACQPATVEMTVVLNEEEKAEVEAEVKALDDDLMATVVAWDLDPFLSFFGDDVTYALFGEVQRGLSIWRDQVTPFFEQAPSIEKCDMNNLHYQVLSSEIVISSSAVECVGPVADGGPVVIDHTWTAVWVKRNDEWKIVNMSETYPTAETAQEGN